MPEDSEIVEVFRARGLPEAHALRLVLEENSIAVRIDNELLQGALGELPMGWATAPRIMVRRSDEQAARALIEEHVGRSGGRSGAGKDCLACGAAMGDAETCPVCGWTYTAPAEDDDDGDPETPPDPPAPDRMPTLSADRALWWEVGAVLAVGIVPHLLSSISDLIQPGQSARTPWLDTFMYVASSACTVYLVLYLIYRSGQPWAKFGLDRPRGSDLVIGLVVAALTVVLATLLAMRLPHHDSNTNWTAPRGPWEFLALWVSYAATGLSEELVCRSYLITRLERLRRSSAQAVVISALLFASLHLYQGWPGVLQAVLIGALYGCLFLVFRRVWPLALGHVLFNIYLTL
jgi:membrane protease YdiL (CAAX protease family)